MPSKYFTVAEQKIIRERAHHCCEYCRLLQAFSSQTFHHEHITPSVKDGSDDLDNIAFACGDFLIFVKNIKL